MITPCHNHRLYKIQLLSLAQKREINGDFASSTSIIIEMS